MKMADLVVEYWNDKGSELYNSYRFEDIKAFGHVLNREIGMDKDINILDFGVGTGFISGVLLNEGYENITGIDINENMLDKASKNLKGTNVKLIQADGFRAGHRPRSGARRPAHSPADAAERGLAGHRGARGPARRRPVPQDRLGGPPQPGLGLHGPDRPAP